MSDLGIFSHGTVSHSGSDRNVLAQRDKASKHWLLLVY